MIARNRAAAEGRRRRSLCAIRSTQPRVINRRLISTMPIARPRLLGPEVFDRPADRVARELLGQWLVVRGEGGSQSRQMIFETEAYLGAHDLAYHRSRGLTPRNAAMFGPAGHSYLYLCYGLHWMLNIVTGHEGIPAAVLVRGAGRLCGPGRLTKGLGLNGVLNDLPAVRKSGLWLEDSGSAIPCHRIKRTPRIGVESAGEWAKKPLRFVIDPALH